MFGNFSPITCLQTCYFSWLHTIRSQIFLFFSWAALADILHIFFPLMFFFSLIITLNSSWLISMSLSAWDTKVSMLSSLLLDNIRILSCFFFLFLVMLSDFLIIPVVREKKYSKTCTCFFFWCSNFACRWHDTNSTTCCAWKH